MAVKVTKSVHSENESWVCKIRYCGKVTNVFMSQREQVSGSLKLDKDRYVIKSTGEIKNYEHTEKRIESYDSVKRSINRLRDIINVNVTDERKIRWVTLTYKDNMTDIKKLYDDFKNYRKKFNRYCDKKGYGKPEYINVVEPQGRGAWHCHIIYIWDKEAPYIPNRELAEIWGKGFVKIKAVEGCDNIGAYFSAYLADMPLEEYNGKDIEEISIKEVNIDGKKKSIVKGGRLYLYPAGMNIYRVSRGIKRPEEERVSIKEYKEKRASFGELTLETKTCISENGKVYNRYTKQSYNNGRKISRKA